MTQDDRDDLFADHRPPVECFRFDENVARVFPDMVRRSVPGYDQLIELIGLFSRQFVHPGTRVYDLGCSLGAVTGSLLHNLPDTNFEVVAVDNAPAMIQGLEQRLAQAPGMDRVRPLCGDIEQVASESRPGSNAWALSAWSPLVEAKMLYFARVCLRLFGRLVVAADLDAFCTDRERAKYRHRSPFGALSALR